MKTKLLATLALAGGCAFAQNYPTAPPPEAQNYPPQGYAAAPPCGPGTVWIDGYVDAYGNQVPGYCAVPPYADAYWIGPTWYGGRFVAGYWGRGPVIRGGFGYRGDFGYRGGYAPGFRGGFDRGRSFDAGHAGGFRGGSTFRAPAGSGGFRAPSGGSNFHSSGGSRGGGFSSHASGGSRGGGSHGGRR